MSKRVRWLTAVGLTALSFWGASNLYRFSSHARRRETLRAQLIVTNANIGIPGITKMYEAKITNVGRLPVLVSRCNFLDDTLSPGTMVAYAVQRWDQAARRWVMVVEWSQSEFCKPYPLGIVKANLVNAWLWPGQSLSTGEEATAARQGLHRGDTARFVVFTNEPGNYGSAVATAPFTIDEELEQSGVGFRLRH